MEAEVTGLAELSAYLALAPKVLFNETKKEIGLSVLNVQAVVTDNFFSGNNTGGNKLHNRTGLLRRSIKTSLSGTTLKTLSGSIHTDVTYAPIHEKGGTIKAKTAYATLPGGPYLNIPLSANKTAAGVMRQNAGEVFADGGYIIKSKAGNYLVMSGTGIPMFTLKRSVVIPPRLGMETAAIDEIPTLLGNLDIAYQKGLSK